MELTWVVAPADATRVRELMAAMAENPLLRDRRLRNLAPNTEQPPRSVTWREVVACRLSSQQRSGPASAITRLLAQEPFPLRLDVVAAFTDREREIHGVLTRVGGIRFARAVASDLSENHRRLAAGGWELLESALTALRPTSDLPAERRSAAAIAALLRGFGPKQSRNLLQGLGLTRYVVPIDSRIARWLNNGIAPWPVRSAPLSDEGYYCLVEDMLQQLAASAGVFPCELDAAVFARVDGDAWSGAPAVW